MATNTTNYQLKKPATTDYVTIGDINDNMDKIDAQMKANANAIAGKAGTSVATQSANGLMSSTDKTKLDGVDSALAGKVSKSGDTMTGTLYTVKSGWNNRVYQSTDIDATALTSTDNRPYMLQVMDKNNLSIGNDTIYTFDTRVMRESIVRYFGADKSTVAQCYLQLQAKPNGESYITIPNWSLGTNSNDNKVLTIAMANSLPSLVHTTGNETIAGSKRFSQGLIRQHGAISAGSVPTSDQYVPIVNIQDSNGADFGYIRMFAGANSKLRLLQIEVNKLNDDGSTPENSFLQLFAEDENGPARATAPTTPSDATSNEIATANWANSKFQRKITYGTGDPPSGGQAGDIYIKI